MRVRQLMPGLALLAVIGTSACSGGGEATTPGVEVAVGDAIPEALLDTTWPVQLATEASLKDYASRPGWETLVLKRDIKRAVEQNGPGGGAAAARAHGEAAALFRQAALLSSWALIETYGKTPEPTDPVGTAHLLTVAYAIVGDLDKARAESAKLGSTDDPTQAWHGPWRSWLGAGAAWPPDLSGLPMEMPPVAPGAWPEITSLPHYSLPEQGADTRREMGDPGALVALALWHDAAARAAAPELADALAATRVGYRLPAEPVPPAPTDVPMDLLFGSDLMVAADAAFLVAVHGEQGTGAIAAWADRSPLAWVALQSQVDGRIDAQRASEVLSALRESMLARAAARTNGEVQGHQRRFADIAHVGAFRSLALVAEIEADREQSGLLRINAMEKSQKETACPVGLMALGAWDASNRYPSRAQDVLHAQARRFPSLEAARYGLDVMALRVSRERPGETPGM